MAPFPIFLRYQMSDCILCESQELHHANYHCSPNLDFFGTSLNTAPLIRPMVICVTWHYNLPSEPFPIRQYVRYCNPEHRNIFAIGVAYFSLCAQGNAQNYSVNKEMNYWFPRCPLILKKCLCDCVKFSGQAPQKYGTI